MSSDAQPFQHRASDPETSVSFSRLSPLAAPTAIARIAGSLLAAWRKASVMAWQFKRRTLLQHSACAASCFRTGDGTALLRVRAAGEKKAPTGFLLGLLLVMRGVRSPVEQLQKALQSNSMKTARGAWGAGFWK